jgi:hypothetical protein
MWRPFLSRNLETQRPRQTRCSSQEWGPGQAVRPPFPPPKKRQTAPRQLWSLGPGAPCSTTSVLRLRLRGGAAAAHSCGRSRSRRRPEQRRSCVSGRFLNSAAYYTLMAQMSYALVAPLQGAGSVPAATAMAAMPSPAALLDMAECGMKSLSGLINYASVPLTCAEVCERHGGAQARAVPPCVRFRGRFD